ncbi:MAG TPA: hypothetical protein VGK36_19195, partial [Candidatus Angelobacter sp.]
RLMKNPFVCAFLNLSSFWNSVFVGKFASIHWQIEPANLLVLYAGHSPTHNQFGDSLFKPLIHMALQVLM